MKNLYTAILCSISITLPLYGMEITFSPENMNQYMPEEVRQHIIFQQLNYIPAPQNSWLDACKDIVIFKRINKKCYNHVNDPAVILSLTHKLYKQFPNEAHLDNFSKQLCSPGTTKYCNKSRELNPINNLNLNANTITQLVEEGADVNCRIKYHFRDVIGTPLMYFVSNPHYPNGNDPNHAPQLECIQTLFDLSADCNVIFKKQSVLTLAISQNRSYGETLPYIITLLLKRNLHHTIVRDALSVAISYDEYDIIKLLIQQIQETSHCAKDDLGLCLCKAVELKKQDIIDKLLLLGANPSNALAWLTSHILSLHIQQAPIDQLNQTFTLLCNYLSNNNNNSQAIDAINMLNETVTLATRLLNSINSHGK